MTFLIDDMDVNTTYLNNISLDDDNLDNNNPETIIHVRFTAWYNRYTQRKTCKKDI